MKHLALVTLFCAVMLPLVAVADLSDDTLRFYLSRSDVVVQGTILNEPPGEIEEVGVPDYLCEFKVSEVLKGDPTLKGAAVRVRIVRFEMGKEDHHPLISKGAEAILFLKEQENSVPSLETADFWFGVQHPFPWLARSLKRLARETARDEARDELTGVLKKNVKALSAYLLEIDGMQSIGLRGDILKKVPDGARIWVKGELHSLLYDNSDNPTPAVPTQWHLYIDVKQCKTVSAPFQRPDESESRNK